MHLAENNKTKHEITFFHEYAGLLLSLKAIQITFQKLKFPILKSYEKFRKIYIFPHSGILLHVLGIFSDILTYKKM